MTDTYKVLGQALTGELAVDNSTVKETIVYEVPAGTKTSVSAIEITNSDTSSQNYTLSFVKSDEVSLYTESIENAGGTFIALGYDESSSTNRSAYSTDGITWTESTLPFRLWRGATYGNGKFVAVARSTSSAFYSTDGITWTESTLPSSGIWTSVAYGNGKFLTIKSETFDTVSLAYSTDGISWAASSFPSFGYNQVTDIKYANGKFVVVGAWMPIFYSTDGITWTQSSIPNQGYLRSVTYGSGKFVVAGDDQIFYSADAISWEKIVPSVSSIWNNVEYTSGKFFARGSYYGPEHGIYSTDGINWTESTMPSNKTFYGLGAGGGKFVVVGSGQEGYYSTDAINWTAFNFPYSADWQLAEYENNPETIYTSLNKHKAIYNKSIASGETHEIKGGITLSAGDQVRVYSDSAEIITNVYGVEIE